MKRTSIFALVAFCLSLPAIAPAMADETLSVGDINNHPEATRIKVTTSFNMEISRILRPEKSASELHVILQSKFRQGDVDTVPGVSEDDRAILMANYKAKARAKHLSKLLGYDLDGNFTVTEDELRRAFAYDARSPIRSQGIMLAPSDEQIATILNGRVRETLRADTDEDRAISPREMVEDYELRYGDRDLSRRGVRFFPPLDLDLDGDASVSDVEFSVHAAIILDLIDSNDDGIFEKSEINAFRKVMSQISRNR